MILADKIIRMRKKNGWSQEELAERMGVSRQAVSKWEAAQTTPDLEKILQLSGLFGVSTDYLLKDTLEEEEFVEEVPETTLRTVSMEEASAFLEHRSRAAERIALATFLCIISPICLFVLGALSEQAGSGISESLATFGGLIVLLALVAVAVALFIAVGAQNSPYQYLGTEEFEAAYGVLGMVREKQKKFRDTYVKHNILGTCLCILAPIVLLIGAFTENEFITVLFLSAMLVLVGVGVGCFIRAGVRWASMQKLLQEGDFTREGKKKSKLEEIVGGVYWPIVAALYLGWSFLTGEWHTTWIVWPVAGVLFAALTAIVKLITDKKE